jgi:hypothetical protein
LLVIAASVLLVLPYTSWVAYVRLFGAPVQTNTLVGRTEARIRGSYGQPNKDWQGYQSLGLSLPPSLPPGPVRTLIFQPGGFFHPEGGTLWVWLVERDGEWECFESCWFADGIVF